MGMHLPINDYLIPCLTFSISVVQGKKSQTEINKETEISTTNAIVSRYCEQIIQNQLINFSHTAIVSAIIRNYTINKMLTRFITISIDNKDTHMLRIHTQCFNKHIPFQFFQIPHRLSKMSSSLNS